VFHQRSATSARRACRGGIEWIVVLVQVNTFRGTGVPYGVTVDLECFLEKFVNDNAIPMVCFEKGLRKEEVTARLRVPVSPKYCPKYRTPRVHCATPSTNSGERSIYEPTLPNSLPEI
jgi:hypothetical protein